MITTSLKMFVVCMYLCIMDDNRKLFSVGYINVIKNFKNMECSHDVLLSLHQKNLFQRF